MVTLNSARTATLHNVFHLAVQLMSVNNAKLPHAVLVEPLNSAHSSQKYIRLSVRPSHTLSSKRHYLIFFFMNEKSAIDKLLVFVCLFV